MQLIKRLLPVTVVAFGTLVLQRTASGQVHVDAVDGLTIAQGATGSDWDHAFKYLKDALSSISSTPVELWVANGIYRADEDSNNPNGTSPPDRTLSFVMANEIAFYGGFQGDSRPGGGETLKNQRDPYAHFTFLDGDLLGDDDQQDPNTWDDNSYHVVTAIAADETAILDGFIIRNGNANDHNAQGVDDGGSGGGLLIGGENFDPQNSAMPLILRCQFLLNHGLSGGAVYINVGQGDKPVFQNCRFNLNKSAGIGGAVYMNQEDTCLSDLGNKSRAKFVNCLFHDNEAATSDGGAIYATERSDIELYHCTLAYNDANDGSAIFRPICPDSIGGGMTLEGCIIWSNGSPAFDAEGSANGIYRTCSQDFPTAYYDGGGNISVDPEFEDQSIRDFHLTCNSPCINADTDSNVLNCCSWNHQEVDENDLDQDSDILELVPDYDRTARWVGRCRDMGVFERKPVCAYDVAPVSSGPPCGDGSIDVDDLLVVINNWGQCPCTAPCPCTIAPCLGDIVATSSNAVDVDDLLAVINNWGDECGTMNTEMPQSIQECWNECNSRCPGDIECFNACFDGCVEALCKAEIIECDE